MSQASIGVGSTRRIAFFIWAAILSLVFGLLFIGVMALTRISLPLGRLWIDLTKSIDTLAL